MMNDQFGLFDYPHKAGFKDVTTSRDAAHGIEGSGRAAILRSRVLAWFRAGHSGTADECAHALGHDILSIRPRCSELAARKLIEPTGVRRKADGGRSAHVWRSA